MLQEIEMADASVVQLTPSGWQLLPSGMYGRLRRSDFLALCGGEAMPMKLAERFSGGKVLNLYGPTETTIWATVSRLHEATGPEVERNIGSPMAHVNAIVTTVDHPDGSAVADSVGELHLGGPAVARGYRNLPEIPGCC